MIDLEIDLDSAMLGVSEKVIFHKRLDDSKIIKLPFYLINSVLIVAVNWLGLTRNSKVSMLYSQLS